MTGPASFVIGIISDTHGLLRPEAVAALRGVDAIVHAGDVGSPDILDPLQELAPVTAVRGNVDREAWARKLPLTALVSLGGVPLFVLHDLGLLDIDPVASGVRVVVSGHSHRAACEERAGVLYFNPGSAGPRRFSSPVTVGRIAVCDGRLTPEVLRLDV